MSERKELPCKDFRAEPGAAVTTHTTCLNCGWVAYQHLSWAADPDGRRPEPKGERIDTGSQNVKGYKQQSPESLALVNQVKQMESNFASWLEQVYFSAGVGVDARQVASARTHLEYAFYHLVRAVFQPADPIGDAVKVGPRRG